MSENSGMVKPVSSGCAGCGKATFISLRSEKWGACAFCMVLAVTGTIIGWSFTISFGLFYPDRLTTLTLALLSAFFTLVFLGHVIAYRRRLLAKAGRMSV